MARPGDYDDVVYRGTLESREFCAFWLSKGTVIAGMNVNVWDVHPDIRALIKSGASVDTHKLTDSALPIAAAARQG